MIFTIVFRYRPSPGALWTLPQETIYTQMELDEIKAAWRQLYRAERDWRRWYKGQMVYKIVRSDV